MKARFTLRISTIQPSVKESRIRARDLGSFIFDDCRMRYGNDPQHRHPRPAVAAFGSGNRHGLRPLLHIHDHFIGDRFHHPSPGIESVRGAGVSGEQVLPIARKAIGLAIAMLAVAVLLMLIPALLLWLIG